MQYQKSQKNENSIFRQAGTGNFRGGAGANNGFTPVAGKILSADRESITIELPDGGSRIVLISDKTVINKTSEGTAADLKEGEQVTAFGSQNPDGSITAQNVQLGSGFRGIFRVSGTPEPTK